ncbi:Hypothetical predicted protein, partial [Pelobates cultripes]
MEETQFEREMRTRLAFWPAPVSPEIMTIISADAQEYVMAQMNQAFSPQAETAVVST